MQGFLWRMFSSNFKDNVKNKQNVIASDAYQNPENRDTLLIQDIIQSGNIHGPSYKETCTNDHLMGQCPKGIHNIQRARFHQRSMAFHSQKSTVTRIKRAPIGW